MILDMEPLFDETNVLLGHACHLTFSEWEWRDAEDTARDLGRNRAAGYPRFPIRSLQRALHDEIQSAFERARRGQGLEQMHEPRNRLHHAYWYEPL